MGRLTATELGYIDDGGPIKMDWSVISPYDSFHDAYVAHVFDQGMYPTGGTPNFHRITDPGVRNFRVWNPHPSVSPKMQAVRYVFECDNRDGFFYPGAGKAWDQGSYYAVCTPQECFIKHRLYVGNPSAAIPFWAEIYHMNFIGRVLFVTYEDGRNADGDIVPVSATITCEQAYADSVLRMLWNSDHGKVTEVDDLVYT